jgi:adenine-specific DNA-methyltransferase
MAKKIDSIKHKADKRAHIPSREEAGYEEISDKVSAGKKVLELPKNPVVHRGQDPELFWLNKYGNDDRDDLLRVDIRSLYRHEHIAPENLIKNLYRVTETKSGQMDLFSVNELFGNALEKDELEKVSQYYHHQDGWTNRLIQGDSHLVMASLLEREGMAGQVQCIYIDPPYGIKYGSNWQVKLNNRDVKDGNDDALAGEPEVIKAFRDTWELGIHSYLSYLRDRLLIAKELLNESGSCFVQISDENVHLVRNLMDEVFGSENFVSLISFQTKVPLRNKYLANVNDYIIWYGKNFSGGSMKFRQLFEEQTPENASQFNQVEMEDGSVRSITSEERVNPKLLPRGSKIFMSLDLSSSGRTESCVFDYNYKGKVYKPTSGKSWKTNMRGMERLDKAKRLHATSNSLRYKLYLNDYPVTAITNSWSDSVGVGGKLYVVQTDVKAVQRCILMSTDPGDLILDPTCGSGTSAYVAELWGRRWITIDTSRIALNITKQRLVTSTYPYFKLYDADSGDVRYGFEYKRVPHITLGSITNEETGSDETLFDQPEVDRSLIRVSGPFTVETLQNFEPVIPEMLDEEKRVNEVEGAFEEVIRQHLLSAGIKNGRKEEQVVFRSVEMLSSAYLHAEGFYMNGVGEKKTYFHIGPKFGTVSKSAVNEAIKECRQRGDAQWLVILGFSFESDIEGSTQTTSMGKFEVTKCRIHDDLLQDGLKKKPAKSAASFVTIGEPDIKLNKHGKEVTVEICGLDIYDPIKDEVKPRNVHDIAYWMVDDDYDGSNFVVKQVFFCGGDKDEFDKWRKGLDTLSKDATKKKVEKTLKIEIDDEAFDRLYGHVSHPIPVKGKDHRIAVRIVSQFGEECTKVVKLS